VAAAAADGSACGVMLVSLRISSSGSCYGYQSSTAMASGWFDWLCVWPKNAVLGNLLGATQAAACVQQQQQ
jgi:hypothetical protein